MTDLLTLTLAEARDKLKAKEISSLELTDAYLDAMSRAKILNAYVTETPEKAREMAKDSDARLAKGEGGPLEGLPLGIKDLFCTEGTQTTAGSRILKGFIPPYESTVSANLWRDGAVMLGKLNMDEFAMGSSNETSAFGPVVNPWQRKGGDTTQLVPGGSSGGSAAAVSAQLCIGATATDTGGSIRQPAAFTGTVGIKPTYGRCSRWGIVAFASSLDQAGPITRTVRDAAILLKSMAGFDPKDSTSIDREVPNYEHALQQDIEGLKIGIPAEYLDGLPPALDTLLKKGIAWLKDSGAKIKDISLPHTKYALPAYYLVAPAEASSNLARYDGVRYGLRRQGEDVTAMYEETRGEGFGSEVKRRILIGTYALSAGYYDAYYLKAQKVRTLIKRDFDRAFQDVDAVLAPTTPNTAFPIGEKVNDPIAMYLNDVLTVPANMAGLPGLSVPAGLSDDGLPLGLQLIGNAFEERKLFRIAGVLEEAAAFTHKPTSWWRDA